MALVKELPEDLKGTLEAWKGAMSQNDDDKKWGSIAKKARKRLGKLKWLGKKGIFLAQFEVKV